MENLKIKYFEEIIPVVWDIQMRMLKSDPHVTPHEENLVARHWPVIVKLMDEFPLYGGLSLTTLDDVTGALQLGVITIPEFKTLMDSLGKKIEVDAIPEMQKQLKEILGK